MSDDASGQDAGSRPVPGQGFGDLAKYQAQKDTTEPGADVDSAEDDLTSIMEMGIDETKTVGRKSSLQQFGIVD